MPNAKTEIAERADRSAHLDQALPEAAKHQAYLSYAKRKRSYLPAGSG